jgi:hypothetical protein
MTATTAKMLIGSYDHLIPQYYDPSTDTFVAANGTNGAEHVRLSASDVSYPEQWYYNDGASKGTAAGVILTTADVSAFAPFDTLTLTKVGATDTVTATLRLSPGRRGVLIISGATTDTVTVSGTVNGVAAVQVLGRISGALNTIAPMTTIGNGTHFLEF